MQPIFTKVQSGRFRGKKLALPSKTGTRATKSRVKDSLFNTLRPILANSVFVELFAGSAGIAIEASSNYAKDVIAIEKDPKAFKIAKQNASFEPSIKIYHDDAFSLLPRILPKENCILYIDPPFDERAGFSDIYERIFALLDSCCLDGVIEIVFEFNSKYELPNTLAGFKLRKQKSFGNSSLCYFA